MLELLQVTLCFETYSLPEALQVTLPDLFSLGQYLQPLVVQGFAGCVPAVWGSDLSLWLGPGSFARTKISLRFLGLL